ncbi:MAG TPA: PQQ-binding-like beta-propeller repeat protein [Verrucomicrobiae bacterium]|nr:PQQ-binding-like beta-propeller repeat protein [Verrucomicrobiae bacterium]
MNDPVTAGNVAEQPVASSERAARPLRTWPALLIVLLMLATRYGPELSREPSANSWMVSVFGPLLGCLLLLIWWVAASRANWKERVFGLLGLLAGATLTVLLVDPSMRGPAIIYFTLPIGFLLFAVSATVLRNGQPGVRGAVPVLLAVAGFALSIGLRSEGMTGDYKFVFRARWKQTAEQTLLAQGQPSHPASAPSNADSVANALKHPEWPEFRGPGHLGVSRAPTISTNWVAHPPEQLWKIQVGPAWSSFSVAGRMLFTQEQRGPKEAVVCYDADSGKEIWKTEVDARLEDPMGGPGPRATPTLAGGALFVTGSTGVFLRLNPATGEVVWKKNLPEIAGGKVPMWGFASSPLVVGPVVVVYGGGPGDKGLLALDLKSGDLRWSAPCPVNSYSSPQLETVLGEETILMPTSSGLQTLDPATGKIRLDYEWKIPQYRALQPCVFGTDTVLLPTGMNMGTRALRLKKNNGQYTAEELWTSRQLKPDFVDLVISDKYAYGNDGGILTCIDLQTGERKWKDGHYGKGQILLLEKSALLLILAEQGQVVLVAADPAGHREVASFQALQGKTWNHPVVVGDRLYVRNSQEAAAYLLPVNL